MIAAVQLGEGYVSYRHEGQTRGVYVSDAKVLGGCVMVIVWTQPGSSPERQMTTAFPLSSLISHER